jgi:hypothetical protein
MGFFHWVGGQVALGGLFLPPIEKRYAFILLSLGGGAS